MDRSIFSGTYSTTGVASARLTSLRSTWHWTVTTRLCDHLDYLRSLEVVRVDEPTGRERTPRLVLTWPEQIVDRSLAIGATFYAGVGTPYGKASVTAVDFDRREMTLRWGSVQRRVGACPPRSLRDRYFRPGAKASALKDLARQVLAPQLHGARSRPRLALFARDTSLRRGRGSTRGGLLRRPPLGLRVGRRSRRELRRHQGPPGTGKTSSGSHIIHRLIKLPASASASSP